MLVKPTKMIQSILTTIDLEERLPIITNDFGNTTEVIVVESNAVGRGYYLNSGIDNDTESMPIVDAVIVASEAVRMRVQFEKKEVELFPFIDVENTGYIKNILMKCLEQNSDTLEEIDYQFFGAISGLIWRKEKMQSLPVIKRLAPLNASEIIEKTKVFVSS